MSNQTTLYYVPAIDVKEPALSANGLGSGLRWLRERRDLSLREIGQLSGVDHAYIHRLEKGDKSNPTEDTMDKLIRVLRADPRQSSVMKWLVSHPDTDPDMVEYALENESISIELFTAAAGVAFRGAGRPDPETLFARVRQIFEEDAP